MDHMEKARQLRADTEVHYNCAQSVLVTFAKEMGLTEQQAYELGANFGSGMRCGSACGALTGALMVLGMAGQDAKKATDLLAQMKKNHNAVDCAVLLKNSHDQGIPKKEHCDGLVFEMVETLSEILK
jgi:C_GCAxxG_C_C family probable redox protein